MSNYGFQSSFDFNSPRDVALTGFSPNVTGNAINQQAQASAMSNIPSISVDGVSGAGTTLQDIFGKGGYASIGLGAIQTLGSLWNSFTQNKLAKQAYNLQKQAFTANLGDSRQSYNTELEDRIRNRYFVEGKSQSEADAYVAKNRLG